MEDKYQAVQLHSNSNVAGQASGSKRGQNEMIPRLDDEERLPYTRPEARYHIANDTKYKLNIYQWPDDKLANDVAYKVSFILISMLAGTKYSVGLVTQAFGPPSCTPQRHGIRWR